MQSSPVRIIKTPDYQVQYCMKIDRQIAHFEDVLNWHQCPYQRKDKILGNNVCIEYKKPCRFRSLFHI